MAHYLATVVFACPGCGETIDEAIDAPEPYWTGDTADERYVTDDVDVACGGCDMTFWLEVGNQDGDVRATLRDHPAVRVDVSDVEVTHEPDERWDWDLPSDTRNVLQTTLWEIRHLVRQHGDAQQASVFNRMAFSQQVAAMEAYLGDTLAQRVKDDRDALSRIIEGDRVLKAQTLPLATVLADPHAVRTRVGQHLQSQLYHKLDRVSVLYRTALEINLFPDPATKERLFAAMPVRHDCVHRNGLTRDGRLRSEVTTGFLTQMDADIFAMVEHIEEQLRPTLGRRPVSSW